MYVESLKANYLCFFVKNIIQMVNVNNTNYNDSLLYLFVCSEKCQLRKSVKTSQSSPNSVCLQLSGHSRYFKLVQKKSNVSHHFCTNYMRPFFFLKLHDSSIVEFGQLGHSWLAISIFSSSKSLSVNFMFELITNFGGNRILVQSLTFSSIISHGSSKLFVILKSSLLK